MSLDHHLLLEKISPINYMTFYAFQQYVLAETPSIGSRGDGSDEPSLPSFFSATIPAATTTHVMCFGHLLFRPTAAWSHTEGVMMVRTRSCQFKCQFSSLLGDSAHGSPISIASKSEQNVGGAPSKFII
eukprot:scaffold1145_cov77-Skeletonema_dohrnii-CCMP3373.AAC.1